MLKIKFWKNLLFYIYHVNMHSNTEVRGLTRVSHISIPPTVSVICTLMRGWVNLWDTQKRNSN